MHWVDVLNRATTWCDFEAASRLAAASGNPLPASDHRRLVAEAALLHRLFAARHLDLPVAAADGQALLQWLDAVTPRLTALPVSDGSTAAFPGSLGGRRSRDALPEPFESELSGALLQLLATVTDTSVLTAIRRCQGILRRDRPSLLTRDLDDHFARRADLSRLLAREGGSRAQCPRLIVSPRGRRFCSKACSNATFAARKALEDPSYFAEKQERYRLRQRDAAEPPQRQRQGAFVYMD